MREAESNRNGFVVKNDWWEIVQDLTTEQRGNLLTAMFQYSITREVTELPTLENAIFKFIKLAMDYDFDNWESKSQVRSKAGKQGGAPPGNQNASKQAKTSKTSKTSIYNNNNNYSYNSNSSNKSVCASPAEDAPPTHAEKKPVRHEYGRYGWVKLTDEQHSRLSNDLGEAEFKRCVDYIDESAQSTGNKNKWRDWNLVLRRCSREKWGLGGYTPSRSGAKPEPIPKPEDYIDESVIAYWGGGSD